MKKKLFLVLCSCFAGALALSSCGGGGGMDENLTPPELLRHFVNGNFEIVYYGDPNTVVVTGRGHVNLVKNNPGSVTVDGVPVECRAASGSANGTACYTIQLDGDGVPMQMTVYVTDYRMTNGDEEDLLPVGKSVTATMHSEDAAHPFQVRTAGTADFDPGDTGAEASVGIRYNILRAGTHRFNAN